MKHSLLDDDMKLKAALYALGNLTREEALAFEDHLEGCEACLEETVGSTAVARTLAFASRDSETDSDLLPALMGRIRQESKNQGKARLEKTAEKFSSVRAGEGEWVDCGGGVSTKRLFADLEKGTVTSLYRLDPGVRCESHRHVGIEECLVLEGDFGVNGEIFGPGDYRVCMPGTTDEKPFTIGGTVLLIVEPEANQEPV